MHIDPVWPAGASQILISNDGAFGAAGGTQTLALTPHINWTLKQTGPERLPKTVYVRFLGVGMDTQNFTDDIILDQSPPTLQSASLVGGGPAGTASVATVGTTKTRRPPRGRSYSVKIRARDTIAGLCAVGVSARRTGGTITSIANCHRKGIQRLSKVVRVTATTKPAYLRVRNSAGSWSSWRKLN